MENGVNDTYHFELSVSKTSILITIFNLKASNSIKPALVEADCIHTGYKVMTTNTLDLYCFFGFRGDTPGNYFILYFLFYDLHLEDQAGILCFRLNFVFF